MSKAVGSVTDLNTRASSFAGGASGGLLGGTAGGIVSAISPAIEQLIGPSIAINEEAFRQSIAGGEVGRIGGQQTGLASRLEAAERGEGPSLARTQLQSATERGLKGALALQASTRGGNAALAGRQAAQQQAETAQQAARQSAEIKVQEQLGARQQLGQALQAQRGQDIGVAESDRASLQQLEQLRIEQETAQRAARGAAISGLASGGSALAASDENIKKDIKDADEDKISSFLEALSAKQFKFKDGERGDGEQFGILAQDLEKSEIGKELVEEEEGVKKFSIEKAIGASLAAQSSFAKRLKGIEEALKIRKENKETKEGEE